MNTNTTSLYSALQTLIGVAIAVPFLVTTMWPQPVLAFSEVAQPAHGLAFSIRPSISITLLTTPLEEGMDLPVTASAYSSTVEQTDGNPFSTASGTQVRDGVMAANFLPIGTIVTMGSKTYIVEDRLNSRYSGTLQVDVWMPTTEAALVFGVRQTTLTIVSLPQD